MHFLSRRATVSSAAGRHAAAATAAVTRMTMTIKNGNNLEVNLLSSLLSSLSSASGVVLDPLSFQLPYPDQVQVIHGD